jgi:Lrp/AsnC family leucine-responsive transcriptional regulator
MDKKDQKILTLLQENAKISNVKLAEEIGLTPPATLERVKKLEETGLITGYYARVDRDKLGFKVPVLIAVTLMKHQKQNIQAFVDFMHKTPEIVTYFHVTGAYDYLLQVNMQDIKALHHFLINKLTGNEGIDKAETFLIMDEVHAPLPIK